MREFPRWILEQPDGRWDAEPTEPVSGKLRDADARAYRVVGEQLRRMAAGEPPENTIGDRGC